MMTRIIITLDGSYKATAARTPLTGLSVTELNNLLKASKKQLSPAKRVEALRLRIPSTPKAKQPAIKEKIAKIREQHGLGPRTTSSTVEREIERITKARDKAKAKQKASKSTPKSTPKPTKLTPVVLRKIISAAAAALMSKSLDKEELANLRWKKNRNGSIFLDSPDRLLSGAIREQDAKKHGISLEQVEAYFAANNTKYKASRTRRTIPLYD